MPHQLISGIVRRTISGTILLKKVNMLKQNQNIDLSLEITTKIKAKIFMTSEFKNELEKLTDIILEIRKKTVEHVSLVDSENVKEFESIITDHIIPLIKDSSIILGRSGCSLNYYSNELAVIRDSKKRIFIQILFYPYGQSKITLGVNAPFLQFSYSPAKGNIKIISKISIHPDEGTVENNEIEINDFTREKIDKYILDFFVDTVNYNT